MSERIQQKFAALPSPLFRSSLLREIATEYVSNGILSSHHGSVCSSIAFRCSNFLSRYEDAHGRLVLRENDGNREGYFVEHTIRGVKR